MSPPLRNKSKHGGNNLSNVYRIVLMEHLHPGHVSNPRHMTMMKVLVTIWDLKSLPMTHVI